MLAFLLPTTHPRLASASHDLQIASAEAATRILRALRFPSARYGTTIVTEDALNNVSEACSGMNTLTALLLFTLVLAFLLRLQPAQTLASVAFMLPLALATNGARIAFISWLHWQHGYDIAMGDLHNLSAYALFALAYATLFAFMRHLTFITNTAQPTSAPPSHPARPDHA
jgi:exosortase